MQGDVAGERDEVVVLGDEVGVAVDLDERADLAVGVDVGLDGALGGLAAGELGGAGDALLAQVASTAASTSPPVSGSAFLQSIIPAPVMSRRALTSFAEMSLTGLFLGRSSRSLGSPRARSRLGRLGAAALGGGVLLERLVGDRLAVLGGLLGRAPRRAVVEVPLACGRRSAGTTGSGCGGAAGLDRLGDLGLGGGASPPPSRRRRAASWRARPASASLARLLLGLAAGALLGLAAGLLLGLLARALLLGAEARWPSATTSPIARVTSAHERIASSLPGMTKSMPSGSQLVSTRPMIGMRRRWASLTAIASVLRSMTNIASGGRCMFLTPPRLACSFSRSACAAMRSRVGSSSSWPSVS